MRWSLVVAVLGWLPSVIALTDATLSTLIQTLGVVISTLITATVTYMGLRLNQATKRRGREDDER